jgi:hypothetical protein
MPAEKFGCEACWPASAEAAETASRSLVREAGLIDESHFIVSLWSCGACGQRFVSVFTEMIDWADGEDPQYRTVLPITEAEARTLKRSGSALTESELNSLAPKRRSLYRDHPKDKPVRIAWGTGLCVGPHD